MAETQMIVQYDPEYFKIERAVTTALRVLFNLKPNTKNQTIGRIAK